MKPEDLMPWDLDALQRLDLAKEELIRTAHRIRLVCLLRSLEEPGDGVLTFSCRDGRITLTADGRVEVSTSDV